MKSAGYSAFHAAIAGRFFTGPKDGCAGAWQVMLSKHRPDSGLILVQHTRPVLVRVFNHAGQIVPPFLLNLPVAVQVQRSIHDLPGIDGIDVGGGPHRHRARSVASVLRDIVLWTAIPFTAGRCPCSSATANASSGAFPFYRTAGLSSSALRTVSSRAFGV